MSVAVERRVSSDGERRDDGADEPDPVSSPSGSRSLGGLRKRWRRSAKRLIAAPSMKRLVGRGVYGGLRFVHATQRLVPTVAEWRGAIVAEHPAIVGPLARPAPSSRRSSGRPICRSSRFCRAMPMPRSTPRWWNCSESRRCAGSGGRPGASSSQKGGARALIALRRCLADGIGVCMIADVPKGTPREAGLGIVTLARISGRPVLPSAAVTSRRHVVESSWDKTTVAFAVRPPCRGRRRSDLRAGRCG